MKPDFAKSTALKVLNALKSAGIDALCVGGCPRDIRYGKDVGDIDIVVRDTVDADAVYAALSPVMDETSGSACDWAAELFREYGDDNNLLGENEGEELNITTDFRERVDWVYKFCALTEDEAIRVDILAARNIGQDEPLNKFLDTFDFTINQMALSVDGLLICATLDFGRVKPIEGLTRCDRTNQRYKRLSAKYPDHDWAAVELFLRWTL